jgi:hypothetical protein
MKRGMAIALLIVTTAAAGWAQQGAPAPSPAAPAAPVAKGPVPVIDIVEKVKDFGIVSKGEKIDAVFEVKNKGDAPLEISQVRPTCGCTVADFDKSVPPGGTGKVRASVDTSAFSGPISKAILVFSNDPSTPQMNLVIKAEVRSLIEAIPRGLLLFRSVLQGESSTEKAVLVSAEGGPFKVLGIQIRGKDYTDSGRKAAGVPILVDASATPSPYEVTVRELPEKERVPERKGPQYEIAVTVPPKAPEGMLNDKVIVKTDMPKASEVPLNITGAVRAIIQVVPPEINLGNVAGDAEVGQPVLLVNNRQGTELQITEATVDNPAYSAQIMPLQAGQRYQVAVTLKAGAAKGAQKGILKIVTNDPTRKTIEVPVSATVQ